MRFAAALPIALAILALGVTASTAQTSDQTGAEFRSIGGRFGIQLPQNYSSYDPGVSLDLPNQRFIVNIYRWNLTSGQFSISYATSGTDLESQASIVLALFREKLRRQPGKLISERQIDLGGHPGIELGSESKDFVTITQVILVKNRFYLLTMSLNAAQRVNTNGALAVFNSFHLLSSAIVEADRKKALADLVPQPLPQEPVVRRHTTDWQDEGLKGKVRELLVEREDIWPGAASDKYLLSEVEFNENGDRLRYVEYRSGVPAIAITYGYEKRRRVATLSAKPVRWLLVTDEGVRPTKYSPPEKLITVSLKFEYRYNDTGQLLERRVVRSNGLEYERFVRDLAKNKIELSSGPYSRKITYFLDDKGNHIEKRFVQETSEPISQVAVEHIFRGERVSYSTVRETYTYEFDSQGNWTKQFASRVEKKDGKTISTHYRTTYRRITYF